MKKMLLLFCLLAYSFSSLAGNGVERGSVKIEGNIQIQSEIKDYLSDELSRCSSIATTELFHVENVSERRLRVDNGITDIYYKFRIQHLNENLEIINNLTIEILDSDFHNWRHYEEKLSFEIINDQNEMCKL